MLLGNNIQAQVVDPKTWTAIVKDFNYVGNIVEVQIVLTNNLNAQILQRFVVATDNPDWKKDLQNKVRTFISSDDTKKQTKLDIFTGLALDLSDPIPTPPPDPDPEPVPTVDDIAVGKFSNSFKANKLVRAHQSLDAATQAEYDKASAPAKLRMDEFLISNFV